VSGHTGLPSRSGPSPSPKAKLPRALPTRGRPLNLTGGGTQQTGVPQKVPGVTFGGKPMYIPGPNYFSLTLGLAPGSGTITMKASDVEDLQANNSEFTLRLRDGQRELRVEKLFIKEVRHQDPVHTGDAFVNVIIEDQRSKWPFHDITGIFNKLREDGISYVTASTDGGTPFTLDQLLQKLFDAMDVSVTANTGIPVIPQDVVWEGATPSSMIKAILQAFSFDVALAPDGSVELLQLTADGEFEPPNGFNVWGDTSEKADPAHTTPGTLRMMMRKFAEKESTAWEPVLQYDEDQGGEDTSGVSARAGQWDTVSKVCASFGINEPFARAIHYRRGDEDFIYNQMGGGEKGRKRLAYLRGAIYRFWRFTDTDRDKILPIARVAARTSGGTGRETAQGPRVSEADFHFQRRQGFGAFFKNVRGTGGIPWGVKVVNAREGIVHVRAPRPLTKVDPIGTKSPYYAAGFQLSAPAAPKIVFGYYKKFSPDPEDDYFIVTDTVQAANNGLTLTKRDPKLVYREDSEGNGINEDELQRAAEQYLTEWAAQFDLPTPRQVRLAGVWSDAKLDTAVRAITFRWESGVETNIRVNSDRTPDRYGLGFSSNARSLRFSGAAEAARVVLFDDVQGAGGGVSTDKHSRGALGQTPPQLREFAESREWEGGYQEEESIFVNAEHAGLCVAEDWEDPGSDEDCRPAQTTRPGTTPTTRAGTTRPGQGVQISGGPADQGGG
jgi:hypothetical protein